MNRLSTSERAKIIAALVEGNSLRSTSRLCNVAFNTVLKLVPEIGFACADYHDANLRNVRARRIQCDEIWQFVGAKHKNATPEQKMQGWGDVWTWTAIDADTKLCISYMVGGRDSGWAFDFMQDVAQRVRGRVQLTTDGHKPYLEAVENAFGMDVDFATELVLCFHRRRNLMASSISGPEDRFFGGSATAARPAISFWKIAFAVFTGNILAALAVGLVYAAMR